MARLPAPGSDNNIWGDVLNTFLEVSHNTDGTLQKSAMQQAGGITSVNGKSPTNGSVTLGGITDWVNVVLEHNADPSGAADSTTAFQNAIAALPSGGGNVYIPAGTYKINGTLSFAQNQGMIGDGSTCTSITYTGSTILINVTVSGTFTGGQSAGRFEGFNISGYAAGTNAIGMQIGDLEGVQCRDIAIYGFGSTGLYFKNTLGWAEESNVQARIVQCGTAVVFDTGSFDYAKYDFTIVTGNGQGGVTLQNGAQLQGCSLQMRGNFYGNTGSNTAAVIAVDPGNSSGTSYIKNTLFDVAVESAGSGVGHYTVLLGSSNSTSQFFGTGVLSFSNVTVNFQGVSNPNYLPFGFSGVLNDTVLGEMSPGDGLVIHGGTQWTAGGGPTDSLYLGNLYFQFGDVNMFQLASGNTTLTFNGVSGFGKKVDLFIVQPTSGAAGTVTWPSNVKWASATAPTLSTTNGYTDHIRLYYIPGAGSWYGELVGVHYG